MPSFPAERCFNIDLNAHCTAINFSRVYFQMNNSIVAKTFVHISSIIKIAKQRPLFSDTFHHIAFDMGEIDNAVANVQLG